MRDRPWTLIAVLSVIAVIVCGAAISIAIVKMAPPPYVHAPEERLSFVEAVDLHQLCQDAAPETIYFQIVGTGAGSGSARHDPERPWLQREEAHQSQDYWIAAEGAELKQLLENARTQFEQELQNWNEDVSIETVAATESFLVLKYTASNPAGNFEGSIEVAVDPLAEQHRGTIDGRTLSHRLELKVEEERWGIDPREGRD